MRPMNREELRALLEALMNAEASLLAATHGGPRADALFREGLSRLRAARKDARAHLNRWPGGDGDDEPTVVVSSANGPD